MTLQEKAKRHENGYIHLTKDALMNQSHSPMMYVRLRLCLQLPCFEGDLVSATQLQLVFQDWLETGQIQRKGSPYSVRTEDEFDRRLSGRLRDAVVCEKNNWNPV